MGKSISGVLSPHRASGSLHLGDDRLTVDSVDFSTGARAAEALPYHFVDGAYRRAHALDGNNDSRVPFPSTVRESAVGEARPSAPRQADAYDIPSREQLCRWISLLRLLRLQIERNGSGLFRIRAFGRNRAD